ncbi:MAG: sodium/proton antiporter NhaA [Bacteroidales bacterium]
MHAVKHTERGFNIRHFIREESLGGLLLIGATLVALIWANSGYQESYDFLWHKLKFSVGMNDQSIRLSLQHWINDGLMALFFFMIGLEVKREVLAGELSSVRKAGLPIAAAVGGMVIPAAFYVLINMNSPETINGWGVPMATDIAFVLGILSLLGDRVPVNLKVFLTALAIADDLGAILVIAVFYTDTIHINELINAGIFLVVLFTANRIGIRNTGFYAIVGLFGVWMSFLFSGVHATIAGVLIALTIPVRSKIDEEEYIGKMCNLVDKFENEKPNDHHLLTQKQSHLLGEITKLSNYAQTPLQKLEHALHPLTAFIILPLFALSNAGVKIDGNIFGMIIHPVSTGVIIGLIAGKAIGIYLFSVLMVRLKLADLPSGVTRKHLFGAGIMAGIGFTMSIFISGLAFENAEFEQIAKVGIIVASIVAATLGMVILASTRKAQS